MDKKFKITKRFNAIFEELEATNQFLSKVKILTDNQSNELKALFTLAYNSSINWSIPEGVPPYKKSTESPEGADGFWNLQKNLHQFNMFLVGRGFDNMKAIQREKKYIQMLEAVTPIEAKWILQVRAGNLEKCSLKVVHKAFPGLIPV